MKAHQPNVPGFTLLELMVVIGIFGILIAIAAPRVSGLMRSSRLVGASNTLTSDLYYARALANSQRRTFKIEFQANAYTLSRVSPASTIRTRALPRGVAVASTDTATFYPWGLTKPVVYTMTAASSYTVLRLGANGSVSHD